MFAWLFERKIFSPISDPSTFFMKRKTEKKKKKKKTNFLLKNEF